MVLRGLPSPSKSEGEYDPTIEAVGSSAGLVAALINWVGFGRRKDLP